MPSRNLIKISVANGYYHIYNRGVEKRTIFEDEQDYKVFLKNLKESLSPPPDPKEMLKSFSLRGTTYKGIPRPPKNFFKQVELLAYCLMPNHFHLLIKQIEEGSMESFMRSLATRYSMYFNKKNKRVGSLFQGIYKASMIDNDNYLLHLSRYIHLNPSENTNDLASTYSSYADYLGLRKTDWIKTDEILSFFNNAKMDSLRSTNTYKDFVENYKTNEEQLSKDITLEED